MYSHPSAVASTSPGFVYNRQYVIAVLATSGAAQFAITASFGGSFKDLLPNVPMSDSVRGGNYTYFRLLLNYPGQDVRISVTPISGDPDLYVSVSRKENTMICHHRCNLLLAFL